MPMETSRGPQLSQGRPRSGRASSQLQVIRESPVPIHTASQVTCSCPWALEEAQVGAAKPNPLDPIDSWANSVSTIVCRCGFEVTIVSACSWWRDLPCMTSCVPSLGWNGYLTHFINENTVIHTGEVHWLYFHSFWCLVLCSGQVMQLLRNT